MVNFKAFLVCVDILDRKAIKELSNEEKARFEKEKPKITYKVYDENNRQIKFKEPFWKRIFRHR